MCLILGISQLYAADDKVPIPEDDNWEEQAANRLTDAMQGLDERSQDIIRARWLDEDNKSTLQELADRYGVSAERVRQLEKNAMKKLRAAIEA